MAADGRHLYLCSPHQLALSSRRREIAAAVSIIKRLLYIAGSPVLTNWAYRELGLVFTALGRFLPSYCLTAPLMINHSIPSGVTSREVFKVTQRARRKRAIFSRMLKDFRLLRRGPSSSELGSS